jgi:hypothetical protein
MFISCCSCVNIHNNVNILFVSDYAQVYLGCTYLSINVLNNKEVRMLLVVDDDSGDQRSQLIFLLDLILISVITIHVMISQ